MFDILIPWERGPNALDSYKGLCPFPPRLAHRDQSPPHPLNVCVPVLGAALAVYTEVPKVSA